LAGLTFAAMKQMFTNAREIMKWLGTCAGLVGQTGELMTWITPLGLPVAQPYRRPGKMVVKTMLQNVVLTDDSDSLPVSVRKQRTAFPPNYVHSLDSTHMLLTTKKCEEMGLTFAAVHDSFWTHPSDVDKMNVALREAFVEMHSQPLLHQLHAQLQHDHPGVEFPPVPHRGELDIRSVLDSRYFFQ
jgi:DNA-directed RNA polymerase